MTIRLAADTVTLLGLVAVALVISGALLDELVEAWRRRR